MLDQILFPFIYFGGGLAVLFSFGQFIRPGINQRRIVLVLFFASLGVIQLHAALVHSRDILAVPHLWLLNVPALYFFGPLLAGYLRAVSESDVRFRTVHYLHLLPGVIATLALVTVYALSAEEKIALIQTGPRNTYPVLLPVVFRLALLSVLIYSLVCLRATFSLLFVEEPLAKYRRPLAVFFFLFVTAGALANIGYALRIVLLVRLAYGTVTLVLISLYFIGLRYPNLLLHAVDELRRQRSAQDRLKGVDLAAIDADLQRLMEVERVYQDENLSLESLAVHLRMSPAQLSLFLNTQLGKNFNVFVNEYRVREAGHLLRAEPKRTVLSIAYAVGFNSSSAFHEAFRRFAGTTPGKYRQDSDASGDA